MSISGQMAAMHIHNRFAAGKRFYRGFSEQCPAGTPTTSRPDAALTQPVIGVEKEQERGNDGHGSKVIVVPFDGAAMDHDLRSGSK